MAKILVVDDEAHLRTAVASVLRARGHSVEEAGTGEIGLDAYMTGATEVVVLDMVLPGISGLQVLAELRQRDARVVCVIITAHGSVPSAVEAMRAGAYDYVTKPFDNNDLVRAVDRALEHHRLTARVVELEQEVSVRTEFSGVVGRSEPMNQVLRRMVKAAKSDATVLISGETGTGKELAALNLHRSSSRANGPFVAVNCGAIAMSLAEDEFFGHVRGAFTDARADRRGRFEQAHGGTLFLDEIGDLPLDLQVKLLRVIQEREICRLGSDERIRVDFRLVAATNRRLADDVAKGRFRSDLFWRLNVLQIEMPALRHHLEDLPLLVAHLLDRVNIECRAKVTGICGAVQRRFENYSWPGNIRELISVLRHGVVMTEGELLKLQDLPDYLLTPSVDTPLPAGSLQTLEQVLAETEERLVKATVERFKGNRSAAAAALGIDRRTLFNKLRQYRDDTTQKPES